MNPPVTVIMRTKNVEHIIGQTMKCLFSQDYTDFALHVVDSGSTDDTLQIVNSFPCTISQIDEKEYIPGAVLNSAIEDTHSKYIVFLNSDTLLLSPHALNKLITACESTDADAAFARQVPYPDAYTWVQHDYERSFPPHPPAPPWITLSLPFAVIRRSAWEEHHFSTRAWASEDTEWGHWAHTNNKIIMYIPDVIVMHSHNYSLRQIYGRQFVEGEADAFIYNKKASVFAILYAYFKAVARDKWYHIKKGDICGAAFTPIRRAVYFYACYKGLKHGVKRLTSNNNDISHGQSVILTHYSQ